MQPERTALQGKCAIMQLCRDRTATSDIMETLLALMVVCTGILLLTTALPSLLVSSPPPVQRSEEISSGLMVHGVFDLARAEPLLASLPQGTTVRLITSDGTTLSLLECARPSGADRFVTRSPVLVRTFVKDFPAILEVSCVE